MTALNDTSREDHPAKIWQRRGLFAAAAAILAGAVAKLTERAVEAGTDGDVVLGASNTTASVLTQVTSTYAGGTGLVGVCLAGRGYGMEATGSQFGIYAQAFPLGPNDASSGVYGFAAANAAAGVWGVDGNASGSGVGVRGDSVRGLGVLGLIPSSSSANTIAIYAQNYSTYAGASPGAGGFAIYGLCANGHGLVGATAAAGAAGVVGATNGVAGAYAAAFYGPVIVGGDFTVFGAKSAAVPHPDGTHRRLYCVESPESWFEDFGKGELTCGQADVTLDPDFAAVSDLADYHVFLTAYDGNHLLHVTKQTSKGFIVRAGDSSASGRFSWRVVARRKDITASRLETVDVPLEPQLPNIPERPTAPVPPRRGGA